MNSTVRHFGLGVSTGVTLFAALVPLIHFVVELTALVGLKFGPWNNPVEVFIFLMTAAMLGVFPWGLWMMLTDARRGNMFEENHEVIAYLLAAIGAYLILTLLVCTRLQAVYAQFRWFFTPVLFICAAALIYRRWRKTWGFPTRIGFRAVLDYALALERDS